MDVQWVFSFEGDLSRGVDVLRNFGAVIVLSAANFPRYEVFESGP